MARRCNSEITAVSEHGYSVYLKAKLTTDYAFPFDPGDGVEVITLPNRGVLIVPEDEDVDPDAVRLSL